MNIPDKNIISFRVAFDFAQEMVRKKNCFMSGIPLYLSFNRDEKGLWLTHVESMSWDARVKVAYLIGAIETCHVSEPQEMRNLDFPEIKIAAPIFIRENTESELKALAASAYLNSMYIGSGRENKPIEAARAKILAEVRDRLTERNHRLADLEPIKPILQLCENAVQEYIRQQQLALDNRRKAKRDLEMSIHKEKANTYKAACAVCLENNIPAPSDHDAAVALAIHFTKVAFVKTFQDCDIEDVTAWYDATSGKFTACESIDREEEE